MSFLKAEWRKLAFINYEVDAALLQEYLPYGTELDFWADKCYVSLVGFMFLNTQLLGIKIPYHVNFEEVNLRFYVRRFTGNDWRRGVVFIKEMVPKPAITFVANTIYKENYETVPIHHRWDDYPNSQEVEYWWKKNAKWQSIKITAEKKTIVIEAGSEAEFITEHYWGYAKANATQSNEYEVRHPRWLQYPVVNYEIEVDFERTYGKKFRYLNDCSPTSVMLAEGSAVTIENKALIKM